jgi:hypothetical protein
MKGVVAFSLVDCIRFYRFWIEFQDQGLGVWGLASVGILSLVAAAMV